MALASPHRDWRLPAISAIDVRAVDLDAVLTQLWLRILHGNRPLVRRPGAATTVSELANEIEQAGGDWFTGFDRAEGAAEAWLRADLVKTLRRKPERFTVARPVHGLATRLRSGDTQTEDSDASLAVYSWLEAVDQPLKRDLKAWISVDVDAEGVDLATYALARLGSLRQPDTPRSESASTTPSPLCLGQAATYADDLRRLLAYEGVMPRSVIVGHIRRLTGLHLGLSLLRTFRLVTDVFRDPAAPTACARCRDGRRPRPPDTCPYGLQLIVDCGEDARSDVAKLAESSWDEHEDSLARYVRSHLALKKLDEFGGYLDKARPKDALPHRTVHEIAELQSPDLADIRDLFFDTRIAALVEGDGGPDGRTASLVEDYQGLGLSPFDSYTALLAHFSERRWVTYHRYLLDSLLGKNSSDGLLRQPLGGRRKRRGALGAALLETLTLIAVVHGDDGDYFTSPLRVDQLITRLETRYGLRIVTPPDQLANDIDAPRLLAANTERFKARLRETGLFTDLSDAFLAQLVRPRHVLGASA